MALDVGQQLELVKHELGADLEPGVNDYAAACTAMLFILDDHWDEFVAWNADSGIEPPRAAFIAAMARLDEGYKRGCR